MLEAHGIDYAIGGALAYGVWGIARGTVDADINVFPDDEQRLVTALREVPLEFDPDQVDEGTIFARYGNIRVELFLPTLEFSNRVARPTRVRLNHRGQDVWFLSAEAIAFYKLLFFRDQDMVDLEGLLWTQLDLDLGLVRTWMVDTMGAGDPRIAAWDRLVATRDQER